jgi:nucleoid DNA-binding protein
MADALIHLSDVLGVDVEHTTKSTPAVDDPVFVLYESLPSARTVTLKALAKYIAEENSLPKTKAQTHIVELLDKISKSLDKGERVRFGQLGVLEKRRMRAARVSDINDLDVYAKYLTGVHHELSYKDASSFLSSFIGNVTEHLRRGERVNLSELGILVVRRGKSAGASGDIEIGSEKVAIQPSRQLTIKDYP